MRIFTTLLLVALATSRLTADDQQGPAKRPTKIWNRTGPLGETPKHVTDDYPLSDQQNDGGWVKFEPMSDEFEGDGLDMAKWNLGIAPWRGRQPGLFSDDNVTVSDGKLHLTMRKEKVPEKFEKLGYKDYTSAALHTKTKTAYGYFETKELRSGYGPTWEDRPTPNPSTPPRDGNGAMPTSRTLGTMSTSSARVPGSRQSSTASPSPTTMERGGSTTRPTGHTMSG